MSAQKCSLCNGPAVWSIQKELFCEAHKKKIVARFGIDFFLMYRLSEAEEQFIIRGRHKQSAQSVRPPSPTTSRKPRAR